jgi:hypothetical protein
MLFTGGATSITHMHFDIDLSNILHTQFAGRKRVLLFPFEEQYKLYRKPYEVLSLADFSNYYMQNGSPDYEKFPALKLAQGTGGCTGSWGYFIYACRLVASHGIS